MQVTSIQPNAPVPATAPLPVETPAPAVACEETTCLAKDALVQSTDKAAEAPAEEVAEVAKKAAETIFDWAISWFNISFLASFRPYYKFSRDEEDEEEARAANLERRGAESRGAARRSAERRYAEKSLQDRIKDGLSTMKAVDEARKFHQAVEHLQEKAA